MRDIPEIVRLERASETAAHWSEAQYESLFAVSEGPGSRLGLIAEKNAPSDAPAGSSKVLAFLVARAIAGEWELENVVVDIEARGNGIGTRLIQELLARVQRAGGNSIFLEVRETNVAARALYEKLGFRCTGRRKSYYNNPIEDAILYSRRLP